MLLTYLFIFVIIIGIAIIYPTIKESTNQILVYSVATLKISAVLILIGGLISSIYCFNEIKNPSLIILYIIFSSVVFSAMFYIISKCGQVIINKKLL